MRAGNAPKPMNENALSERLRKPPTFYDQQTPRLSTTYGETRGRYAHQNRSLRTRAFNQQRKLSPFDIYRRKPTASPPFSAPLHRPAAIPKREGPLMFSRASPSKRHLAHSLCIFYHRSARVPARPWFAKTRGRGQTWHRQPGARSSKGREPLRRPACLQAPS